MNVFMHGTIAAGFGVLKSKFDKDVFRYTVFVKIIFLFRFYKIKFN